MSLRKFGSASDQQVTENEEAPEAIQRTGGLQGQATFGDELTRGTDGLTASERREIIDGEG